MLPNPGKLARPARRGSLDDPEIWQTSSGKPYNPSMSELPGPFKALEKMSDAELLHLRAEAAIKKAPDFREIHDAELLRRQMARQTRATKFAAAAAVAAAISALANLAITAARFLGWLP